MKLKIIRSLLPDSLMLNINHVPW